ncbi:MAG: hypothetical protein QME21_07430 [Anaerolineales bacterium]|nr:hypothetical protein [Anaerolineales bacterium]
MKENQDIKIESVIPAASLVELLIGILAIVGGAALALALLPQLLPGLTNSLSGDSPQAFWFISRGSAWAAFGLLWASMGFGLAITNRMARLWPGGPAAVDLHQYTSLLGLGFGLFHALILLGDRYINFSISQIFIPFSTQAYKPVWVGIGQLGFYLWGIIVVSFYLRKRIGSKTWRLVHYASFLTFILVLIHGLSSGTDSPQIWANLIYWSSGGSLLFLIYYRVLSTVGIKRTRAS